MESYVRLINAGWCPTWTGEAPRQETRRQQSESGGIAQVLVRLGKGSRRVWAVVPISLVHDSSFEVLYKQTAIVSGSTIGLLPHTGGQYGPVRAASIQGIAPFTVPGYGVGRGIAPPSVIRAVGLDIEQTVLYRGGRFPLPTDPLISIAIVTWDGRYLCRYVPGFVNQQTVAPDGRYDVAKVSSSLELASWAVEWLVAELPDFVVIHNGYNFDIPRLAAHCRPSLRQYFRDVNLGKSGTGLDLCIPGVTVIDTYSYLDKLHRSEYVSTSLDSLAGHVGEPGKLSHPPLSLHPSDTSTDVSEIVAYNIHDSYLHLMVAVKTNCLEEVIAMCSTFKCPIADACRFISGTLVCCMVSSFALSNRKVIDWSEEPRVVGKYRGALVIPPLPGYHKQVAVLDVSSMYPSVMIDANISCETITEPADTDEVTAVAEGLGLSRGFGISQEAVSWSDTSVVVSIDDRLVVIDRRTDGISRQVLRHLVAERMKIDKKSPRGWTLKVGTNSLYGAMGARTSGLHSRLGAASVTLIGRWLLTVAAAIAAPMGLQVVYGDTDSVFVSLGERGTTSVAVFMDVFHRVLSYTPFQSVRLEIDKQFTNLILVTPKMYYGHSPVAGTDEVRVEVKGLAPRRKDRPQVARDATQAVCAMICKSGGKSCVDEVAEILYDVVHRIERQTLNLQMCSLERRVSGVPCLTYKNASGETVSVPKDRSHGIVDRPSVEWLLGTVRGAVGPVLTACGLPDVEQLVRRHAMQLGAQVLLSP